MRNLYPLPALPGASADVRAAAEAGERNRAPDGARWTDVHLIQQLSTDYAATGLTLSAAAAVLEPLLPRVPRFNSTASAGFAEGPEDPWGTYEQQAWCYGFDEDCFVKLEPAGELVKQIWFECRTREQARGAALRSAVLAIDGLVPSAIADYWIDMAGPVHYPAFLDSYFEALVENAD